MANVLNLEVVAEGVEEKWHMDYLDYLDCDYFQGYYLKKAVDFIKLSSMLERKYKAKGDSIYDY
jgi:EAL domain-containing protein (putative c-di-GMP-specific phosphodiesterase class I)